MEEYTRNVLNFAFGMLYGLEQKAGAGALIIKPLNDASLISNVISTAVIPLMLFFALLYVMKFYKVSSKW